MMNFYRKINSIERIIKFDSTTEETQVSFNTHGEGDTWRIYISMDRFNDAFMEWSNVRHTLTPSSRIHFSNLVVLQPDLDIS